MFGLIKSPIHFEISKPYILPLLDLEVSIWEPPSNQITRLVRPCISDFLSKHATPAWPSYASWLLAQIYFLELEVNNPTLALKKDAGETQ